MLDKSQLKKAAQDWISAWNTRDLDALMQHYDEQVEFSSAAVARRWNIATGNLTGKSQIENHFKKAFEEVPEIRFQFHSLLIGNPHIILLYTRETETLCADLVRFNDSGKVIYVENFQPA